jgi:hypothetical protein
MRIRIRVIRRAGKKERILYAYWENIRQSASWWFLLLRIENYSDHFEGNLNSTKPMDERGIDSSLTLVYSDHQKF